MHQNCNYLYKTVYDKSKKLLSRPIIYHPLLVSTFSKSELKMIFEQGRDITNYKDEIKQIVRLFCKKRFFSRRKISKILKWYFSNQCNGYFDTHLQVEISTDIYKNKLEIINHNTNKLLTKDEFLSLYKKYKKGNSNE